MPKYTVDSPVKHNGTDYEIGSEIELSAKAAQQLLEVGAISEVAARKNKPAAEGDSGK